MWMLETFMRRILTDCCVSAFSTYTSAHPRINRGPPFTHHPLLNFVWLLLLAINSSSSLREGDD
jgi:hypothetical protein